MKREVTNGESKKSESSDTYKFIVENSLVGVFRSKVSGELIYANEAILNMLGFDTIEEMGSKGIPALYKYPEHRDEIIRILKSEGKVKSFESTFIAKNGDERIFLGSLSLKGDIIDGTLVDITKRKRAEELLKESLAKYQVLFDSFPVGVTISDKDGNIIESNQKAEELLGLSKVQQLKRNIKGEEWNIIKSDGTKFSNDEFASVRALKDNCLVENVEMGIVKSENDISWINVTAAPIPVENLGVAIVYSDITERKQTQEALRESEERFRKLLQYVKSVAVQGYGMDGTVKYWNKASENLYGYSEKEAIGKNLLDLIIPPEMKTGVTQALKYMVETGEAIPASELFLMRKDGSRINVFSSHGIVKTSNKEPELFCIDIDISEQKKLETALRESETNLIKLNSEKDKFFSIISHDLRNPFTGLLGFSNILSEDLHKLTIDELQSIAFSLNKSANNLYNLLTNLLEWASMQMERIDCRPQNIDIHKVIFDILESYRILLGKKELTAEVSIPDNLQVFADSNMANSIFRNLIGNAIKFSNRNGKILISAEESAGEVIISVQDGGIGMDKEILNGLFKLNSNIKRTGTEKEPSSGLGLLLCKDFVEKNGGKIWAESKVGLGSTFYVNFQHQPL